MRQCRRDDVFLALLDRRRSVIELLRTVLLELFVPFELDGPLVEDFIDDVAGFEQVLEVREVGHL